MQQRVHVSRPETTAPGTETTIPSTDVHAAASPRQSTETTAPGTDLHAAASPQQSTGQQIVEEVSPFPRSIAVRSRKRKVQAAEVITSSPFKQRLLEQARSSEQKKKNEKISKKQWKKGSWKSG